mmetsp:Transcript_14194/g.41634  ORF Transcript_14194/g.41634 Transcript_14194/m.41634 type:complete len:264 (-) Transcript_14194:53-844(-)
MSLEKLSESMLTVLPSIVTLGSPVSRIVCISEAAGKELSCLVACSSFGTVYCPRQPTTNVSELEEALSSTSWADSVSNSSRCSSCPGTISTFSCILSSNEPLNSKLFIRNGSRSSLENTLQSSRQLIQRSVCSFEGVLLVTVDARLPGADLRNTFVSSFSRIIILASGLSSVGSLSSPFTTKGKVSPSSSSSPFTTKGKVRCLPLLRSTRARNVFDDSYRLPYLTRSSMSADGVLAKYSTFYCVDEKAEVFVVSRSKPEQVIG